MCEYPWKALYEAAILEVDRSKLPALIDNARTAIAERLAHANGDLHDHERYLIETAQHGLDVLRGDVRTNSVPLPRSGQDD